MKIIIGSGRNRRVALDVPCATIVNRSPDNEIKVVVGLVCDLLGIKPRVEAMAA